MLALQPFQRRRPSPERLASASTPRLATEIAKLGPDVMILDLVVRDEVDDNGSNFTATVYYGDSVGGSESKVANPALAGRAAT